MNVCFTGSDFTLKCWHVYLRPFMFGLVFSGDIQIGMVDKKGALEVEIIRARSLVGKPGSKALPGISAQRADFLKTH